MKKTTNFNSASPGFLYAVIVAVLMVLTGVFGVNFPGTPDQIAGEIFASLNNFGIFALIGVVVSSIVLPIWNARTTAGFSWKKLISSRLTLIAVVNLLLSGLALIGLVFPDGMVDQIFAAVGAQDWTGLIVIFFNVFLPTVLRWIKTKTGAAV
jgi:hypothetical protein